MTNQTALRWPDVLAGLSIAGLLLPEAVAYSGLAGLPPQAGVIALFAGLVCYGLIGRSSYAIVSATSSSAAVLAAATASMTSDPARRLALASLLVCGAGIAFAVAGMLRLGAISNLIARPVLRGYTFGLALVIAVKQWPHLVGMEAHHGAFVPLLYEILSNVSSWQVASLGCGLAALAVLFLCERLRPLPGALVVIVASIVASGWLQQHGVTLIGPIHLALALPTFQMPATAEWLPLVEFAVALMFILYAESYGSIRTFALRHDEPVQRNRDLVAFGVANVVSALLQGNPVGAGYSGTSANEAAGAQSRGAGLYAAAVLFLLVLLFLHFIERIPHPVLAAIVIHAVSHSLRPRVFLPYIRWRRDLPVALIAVAAVIAFGVLNGLLAAIAFSVIMLLRSLANPRLVVLGRAGPHDYVDVARYPHAQVRDDILILRPDEPMFFANAEPLLAAARQAVNERPAAKLVVLSLEESPDLDSTALEALGEFCTWLQQRGRQIRVARLRLTTRDALQRAALPQLGADALDYASVDDAVHGECVSADGS
jgi:MFS superfamily sulfate permease-like transporter